MQYGIYPQSTPEFQMFQKKDGTIEMKVRYRKDDIGYLGKWMLIKMEKENDNSHSTQA